MAQHISCEAPVDRPILHIFGFALVERSPKRIALPPSLCLVELAPKRVVFAALVELAPKRVVFAALVELAPKP